MIRKIAHVCIFPPKKSTQVSRQVYRLGFIPADAFPKKLFQWHQCPRGLPYGSGGCNGFAPFSLLSNSPEIAIPEGPVNALQGVGTGRSVFSFIKDSTRMKPGQAPPVQHRKIVQNHDKIVIRADPPLYIIHASPVLRFVYRLKFSRKKRMCASSSLLACAASCATRPSVRLFS